MDRRTSSRAASQQFIFGNAFYHNLGGGKFEEISDGVGVENYWPWGPSVGDLNADGWQDIFIAVRMNFPVPLRHQLAAAQQPRARSSSTASSSSASSRAGAGARTRRGSSSTAGSDGPARSGLRRTGRATITVMAPLGTRSSVMFDLDGDGDLDIVTNEFNSAPQVLVSDLAQTAADPLAAGRA